MSYKPYQDEMESTDLNRSLVMNDRRSEERYEDEEKQNEEMKRIDIDDDNDDHHLSRFDQMTRFVASGPNNLLRRLMIRLALCRSTISYSGLRGHSPTTLVS